MRRHRNCYPVYLRPVAWTGQQLPQAALPGPGNAGKFYSPCFLTALGLCCCIHTFSSCGEQGLRSAIGGLLVAVTSLAAEPRLQSVWASVAAACTPGLQLPSWLQCVDCRGPQALLFQCLWNPPIPEIEPVSPTLADGFLTNALSGKSSLSF